MTNPIAAAPVAGAPAPAPERPKPDAVYMLAVGLFVLFGLTLAAAFVTSNEALTNQMAQALQNIIIAIVAYYWGSSQSSARKDQVIAAQVAQTGEGDGR